MIGIINIYKPEDYTSHDCVAIMRRQTGIKKIGHTGTLDPMATGVLPICIGKATRVAQYLESDDKEYMCTLKLGITTDTYDVWGKTIEEKPTKNIKKEDIIDAFNSFTGEIDQYPPIYSAIKIRGKKLYEYARKGQEVEIPPRKVKIKSIDVLEIDKDLVKFKVFCSKGTYIRSICHEVGETLGCGAAMSQLTRTKSGIFQIEESTNIEDIKKMDKEDISKLLLPPDYPLANFEKISLTRIQAENFMQGKKISLIGGNKPKESGLEKNNKIYFENNFIGIAYYNEEEDKLIAKKVFKVEI